MRLGSTDLRPEAAPLPFHALTVVQQEAYRRLARLLTRAAGSARPPSAPPPGSGSAVALDFDRKSRVAVVSGGRGTGKTTAVLSLIHSVSARRGPEFGPSPSPSANESPEQRRVREEEEQSRQELKADVEALFNRVVWLDILDMAPLPVAANLFTAVLVRVEEAAAQRLPPALAEEKPRSFLDPPEVYDSPLEKLRRLQTDVALSWEGNLKERSAALDATAFAAEVKRVEAVRLKMNRRLAEVLDGLAVEFGRTAGAADPLFVLPIDDFDLNPPRCLELLELLRTLSVPRLFFLALGDMDVAETICALQMAADVARVGGGGSETEYVPIHKHDVQATVANVTGNVIRKLIPPAQRIYLEPMRVDHAVDLRPPFRAPDEPTVGDWLKKIPFTFRELDPQLAVRFPPTKKVPVSPGSKETKDEPPTVQDFLFARIDSAPALGVSLTSRPFYQARKFLEMPLRQLVDFWAMLEETVVRADPGADLLQRFREKLHFLCRDVFRAEETLSPDARRSFRAAFDLGPDPGWTISPDPFRLVAATSPFELRADERHPTSHPPGRPPEPHLAWAVFARAVTGWEFRTPPAQAEETKPYVLAPAAANLLIVYTDLVALSRGDGQRNPLIDHRGTYARPGVVYHFQDRDLPGLGWPIAPFLTFWETDRFLDAWGRLLRLVDAEMRGSDSIDNPIPLLVFNWIRLGTAVLQGTVPNYKFSPSPLKREDWAALRKEVENLFHATVYAPRVRESVHRWIAEVLTLLNRDVIGPDETPGTEFARSGTLIVLCKEENRRFAELQLDYLRREKAFADRPEEDAFLAAVKQFPAWWDRRDEPGPPVRSAAPTPSPPAGLPSTPVPAPPQGGGQGGPAAAPPAPPPPTGGAMITVKYEVIIDGEKSTAETLKIRVDALTSLRREIAPQSVATFAFQLGGTGAPTFLMVKPVPGGSEPLPPGALWYGTDDKLKDQSPTKGEPALAGWKPLTGTHVFIDGMAGWVTERAANAGPATTLYFWNTGQHTLPVTDAAGNVGMGPAPITVLIVAGSGPKPNPPTAG